MNLTNDLVTDIAFNFFIEKHNQRIINDRDVLPLISRISEALRWVEEVDNQAERTNFETAVPMALK